MEIVTVSAIHIKAKPLFLFMICSLTDEDFCSVLFILEGAELKPNQLLHIQNPTILIIGLTLVA